MKETRTAKLYDGLTAKQLARLTFVHTAEQNGLEIERVRGAVERKDYRCLDSSYIDWNTYWISVAQFWATEYWRKLFMHTAALLETYCTDGEQPKKWERIDTTAAALDTWHAVLSAWCERHNLDLDAAYKIAGVPPKQDIPEALIDRDKVEEWLDVFASFMPQR